MVRCVDGTNEYIVSGVCNEMVRFDMLSSALHYVGVSRLRLKSYIYVVVVGWR